MQAAVEKNASRELYATQKAIKELESVASLDEDEQNFQYKKLIKKYEKEFDERYGRYSSKFDPLYKTPRRLTPRECARLMGFELPENYRRSEKDREFRQVCADNRAYKQFGNSVVVPVFRAVASLMKNTLLASKASERKSMGAS